MEPTRRRQNIRFAGYQEKDIISLLTSIAERVAVINRTRGGWALPHSYHHHHHSQSAESTPVFCCAVEHMSHNSLNICFTGNTNLKNHKCKKRFDNSESQKSFVEAKSLARSTSSKAVTKFCIEGRRPPYMISEKPFQHLAQVYIDIGVEFGRVRASDIIPHRTTISRNVEDHANEIRRSLHPEFLKAINDNVCASTVDMWTESIHKFHFMAMTFQYFVIEDVTKEWKLKSKLFFMTPFHKSSTAVNLKEHLLQCCAERGFPEEVVMKLKFVTDNGADLVLALYEFDRIYCYAHYLNVRLESAFKLKVYKVQLFTSEAQDVIDAVVKAALHLKNKKLLSAEYAKVMPKGQKRGPFPSKIPLLRLFYRDFSQVLCHFFTYEIL